MRNALLQTFEMEKAIESVSPGDAYAGMLLGIAEFKVGDKTDQLGLLELAQMEGVNESCPV